MTKLTILVTIHIFLLLTAGMFLYSFILILLNKKGTNKKSLLRRSVPAFLAILISYFIGIIYLSPYYLGKEGFITDASINANIPQLVFIRELLLIPLVILAFFVMISVWKYGNKVNEYVKYKASLLTLSLITLFVTTILVFLGIFIP